MQPLTSSPLTAIFNPDDTILYKTNVEGQQVYRFPNKYTEFYMVNPAAVGSTRATIEQVSSLRNILIEFDGIGLRAQANLVERRELPYALATYSGGKSNHYVVSLQEPVSSLTEYRELVEDIYAALGSVPDPKCKNPNRLTRTPGVIRASTNKEQRLLATGNRVALTDIHYWLNTGNRKADYHQHVKARAETAAKYAANKLQLVEVGRKSLPTIYRQMMEEGVGHPDAVSRHDSLVKFGSWLKHNGYEEELASYLDMAADALGVGERGDAEQLAVYFLRSRG